MTSIIRICTYLAAPLVLVVVMAGTAFAEPELSNSSPLDGAVLSAHPEVVTLCFSEPIQREDGAWQFKVSPGGVTALGLRIVFSDDGSCVDVFPGKPDPTPEGIWQVDWVVKSAADASEGSGSINFQVGALQAAQTPLPAPEVPGDEDGSSPPVILVVLIIIGVAIVIVGVVGFFLRRHNADGP